MKSEAQRGAKPSEEDVSLSLHSLHQEHSKLTRRFAPRLANDPPSPRRRAHARRKQQDQDAYVDEEALKMLYTDDLETTVKFLLELLHEVDNRNSGSVTRQEFKQYLNNPGTGLTKVEAKVSKG